MEIQLQELINQIKKDGVEAAETQAETIIDAAKAEADKIISAAKLEADKLIAYGKAENEKNVRAGEDALRQAGRNLLISFRESVSRELNAVAGDNVAAVYSSDTLTELIVSAIEAWTAKPDADDISVLLNSAALARFEETILAELKARMLTGVTLKANDNFDGGFRIAVNNGAVYYDYSAESVTDMLSGYLGAKITALLKEAE